MTTTTSTTVIRVATRPSKLALAQTELALAALRTVVREAEFVLVPITSEADQRADEPLRTFGDKGAFVARVQEALLDNRADVAVHSLKDLPVEITPGLQLFAYLPREDPRDALVSRDGSTLERLPPGSRVGTGSLRRVEQLQAVRPDLHYVDIRGNVDTRLKKLDSGGYDAVVLAAAGMIRLGLGERITRYLHIDVCTPAPGQGIVALECRQDYELITALNAMNDEAASSAALAERTLAQLVGATCTTAFGAVAVPTKEVLSLTAWLAGAESRAVVHGRQGYESELATTAAGILLANG